MPAIVDYLTSYWVFVALVIALVAVVIFLPDHCHVCVRSYPEEKARQIKPGSSRIAGCILTILTLVNVVPSVARSDLGLTEKGDAVVPKRFGDTFDPAAVEAMMVAFDKVCDALGLARTEDSVTESLAKMIVQQARTGERDPDRLYALTMAALKR